MKSKGKKTKKEEEPLKVFGDLDDVLKAAVKDNPVPEGGKAFVVKTTTGLFIKNNGEYYLEEGINEACVFAKDNVESFVNGKQEQGIWTEYTFESVPI